MSAVQQGVWTVFQPSGRALIEHLNSLVTKKDLGALAMVRRGLGRPPSEVPEIYAHILPFLSPLDSVSLAQRAREEDAALVVAPLYAQWHQGKATPISAERVGLGIAFRQLMNQSDSGSIEQRFVALLKASRNQLPNHLRHAVSLLKAKDIPLDWALLFTDLYQWDQTDRRARHPVRRRWARDFWERPCPQEGIAGAGSEKDDANGENDE